ncbi:hypothetical protein M433DRAFT_108778 [Acidomyces richmondensis BFW]|nr:MAG: hypothetical protein FE78DRAFT_149397 [Acidomyces sp. 'richmondensis']KYG45156.1 hypothetical protein M433DRAFT_108778 [Acidomyces richmondensis BFW]
MADVQVLYDTFGTELSQDVATELQHIQRLLDLSAQELFFKWESYVLKMGAENTILDFKTVCDFKKDLQDALERDARVKGQAAHGAAKKVAATPRAGTGGGDVFGMLDGMVSGTPGPRMSTGAKRKATNFDTPLAKSAKSTLDSSPSTKTPATARGGPAAPFEDRPNAGEIEQSINQHIPAPLAPSEIPSEARVKLKANVELPKFAFKTMAMKLSEASEILDDRIDSFTDLLQQHHKLPDSAFGNPAAQSTAEIVAVGRIACDQPNGRMNAESVVIETSRRMGAGLRVRLKFQPGVGYDLFPGKIVGLQGTNVSGEYFAVTEILEIPILGPPASTPAELDVHNDRLSGHDGQVRPLSMLVASGPYTTDSDLSFAPFHALLAKAKELVSDVLILTGPFLDLEHPIIASGDLEEQLPADAKIQPDRATLHDVFRVLIAEPLQRLVHAIPTVTIIMVPSVRDAISKHVSWPQDRFPKAALGLPKQVQVVTNPILLSINEMVIGISTQDVLSELRRENVYHATKGRYNEDTLERLTKHVIEQRHFFPVFPPQARENMAKPAAIPGEVPEIGGEERLAIGASLDLGYMKLGEWITVKPDILILPSVLSPFVKVIEAVTCINPGVLSKKRGAGHYAAICVEPRSLTTEEREEGSAVAHNVFERARVDITRI